MRARTRFGHDAQSGKIFGTTIARAEWIRQQCGRSGRLRQRPVRADTRCRQQLARGTDLGWTPPQAVGGNSSIVLRPFAEAARLKARTPRSASTVTASAEATLALLQCAALSSLPSLASFLWCVHVPRFSVIDPYRRPKLLFGTVVRLCGGFFASPSPSPSRCAVHT